MPVLVLNASLQPLSVIPERRLIVLLSKQKVAFVDEHAREIILEAIEARRVLTDEPVIVQLLANVRVPRMMLRPTRANILLRDEETCQYCGKHMRELTLDHVLPRSRGGQCSWEPGRLLPRLQRTQGQPSAERGRDASDPAAARVGPRVRDVLSAALPATARGIRDLPKLCPGQRLRRTSGLSFS